MSEKLGSRLLLSLGVRGFDLGTWCEYNEWRNIGLSGTPADYLKERCVRENFWVGVGIFGRVLAHIFGIWVH